MNKYTINKKNLKKHDKIKKDFEDINKEFCIMSICKDDILLENYPMKFVKNLSKEDMEYISNEMYDIIFSDNYWDALHKVCNKLLKDYKKK